MSPAASVSAEPVHPRPATPRNEAPRKKRSDLPARLATAAVLVPSVIYLVIRGGLWYVATVVVVILLGQREIYGLIEDKGARPLVGLGLVAGGALPVVSYVGTEYHATVLLTVTLLAVMVLQLGKAQVAEALASISGTFFGVFYVGWLLSHAVVLRHFHSTLSAGPDSADAALSITPDSGIFFMLFAIGVVVLCDAGAYFAGRFYGKRKLAPTISPSKSVEGAIGGVLAGVLGGLAGKALFDVFWPDLSASLGWPVVALFALVLSIAGILGDLIESLLKRDAEVKDAGRVLPGMGGVLDRIDSVLLSVPVMYYMLRAYFYVLRAG